MLSQKIRNYWIVIIPLCCLLLVLFFGFSNPVVITVTGADAHFSEIMLHNLDGGETKVSSVNGTASFTGDIASITIYNLTPGTYTKVHTKISKLTLHGTYNGLNFSYISNSNLNKNINLDQSVTIDEGGYLTLMVPVDVSSIFMNGNTELDPNDPSNSVIIDRNIRAAFKDAFNANG